MFRYSTTPIEIGLPFDPNNTKELWLTFKQPENDIELNFTKADMAEELARVEKTDEGYFWRIAFTQEQAGAFLAAYPISVQARWKDETGISDATEAASFDIGEVLREGKI